VNLIANLITIIQINFTKRNKLEQKGKYHPSINPDSDGLKYPEDPNPTVPEKKLPDWKPYLQSQGFW